MMVQENQRIDHYLDIEWTVDDVERMTDFMSGDGNMLF